MKRQNLSYETRYGCLKGISSPEYYPDGKLMECALDEQLVLNTPFGTLIPQYTTEGVRKKYIKALTLYHNGNLKRLSLEQQMPVKTPAGVLKAELLTFYESGNIKRIFPLNGKISGYWTEENEFELAEAISLTLPFGRADKKIIGIHFYEDGSIRSLTLWPKEYLTAAVAGRKAKVRYGISFYQGGRVKSMEPAYPLLTETPVGQIAAFDINAIGINGDENSLEFWEDGRVKSLVTSTDSIRARSKKNGKETVIRPFFRPSTVKDEEEEIVPVRIAFREKECTLYGKADSVFAYEEYDFEIENFAVTPKAGCSDCGSCPGGCS